MKTFWKIFIPVLIVGLLALGGWFWFRFYFVFGESWTAGTLNYITNKGYVWKTYEGKLIQEGFGNTKSAAQSGKMTSNEFEFSVDDEEVAHLLEHNAGKHVEVHYKEYRGALPWRGMQRYVVDSIGNISNVVDKPSEIPSVVY